MKISRTIKITFITSLVLNLLAIGLLSGWAIHGFYEHRPFIKTMKHFKNNDSVRELMRTAHQEFKLHRKDIAKIFADMSEVLHQETYDSLLLEDLIDDFKQVHVVRYDFLTLELLRAVDEFTYEERQQLADILQNLASYKNKRHGKERGHKRKKRHE